MYLKLYNPNEPSKVLIMDELTDFLFDEGWRILSEHKWINGDEYLQLDENKRQVSLRQHGF